MINLEVIERLVKVHTTLVENYNSVSASNKAYGGYGGTTNVVKAAKDIALKISLEVGGVKE